MLLQNVKDKMRVTGAREVGRFLGSNASLRMVCRIPPCSSISHYVKNRLICYSVGIVFGKYHLLFSGIYKGRKVVWGCKMHGVLRRN